MSTLSGICLINIKLLLKCFRMDGFNVREAVADDRDDVIGIRDVYGGSDYLPAYYQHFVTSVAITPFVLLYQDKIVR